LAPTISATVIDEATVSINFTVTAPADLKVVRLEFAGLATYPSPTETTQIDARPGSTITRLVTDIPVNVPGGGTITWTARCFSTGNVASSSVTYTHTIPAA
jgi:hypothetical protein